MRDHKVLPAWSSAEGFPRVFLCDQMLLPCSDLPATISALQLQRLTNGDEVTQLKRLEGLKALAIAVGRTGVPDEVMNLTQLTQLHLRPFDRYDSIHLPSELSQLVNLEELHVISSARENDLAVLTLLPRLRCLSLKSSFTEIPGAVAKLTGLESLSLRHVKSLPSWLSSLTRLTSLYLVCSARDVSLSCLPWLEKLHLECISVADLTCLTNLKVLEIKLDQAILGQVCSLTGLEELRALSFKPLQFPRQMSRLTKLRVLKMREGPIRGDMSVLNSLTAMEHMCFRSTEGGRGSPYSGLSSLKSLAIDLCNNEGWYNVFSAGSVSLPNLQELILSDLPIRTLSADLFNLPSLTKLDINFCLSLRCLPGAMGMAGLKTLVLRDLEDLTYLPQPFTSLSCLETLEVYSTELKELPEELGDVHSLTSLSVCYCPNVAHLPESITRLANLKYLRLKSYCIRELPFAFNRLASLTVLQLELHRLRSLPPLTGMQLVDIQMRCSLLDVDSLTFLGLSQLRSLDVLVQSVIALSDEVLVQSDLRRFSLCSEDKSLYW